MPNKGLSDALIQQAVNTVYKCLEDGFTPPGGPPGRSAVVEAAKRLKVNDCTLRHRLRVAQQMGIGVDYSKYRATSTVGVSGTLAIEQERLRLEDEIRLLRTELLTMKREEISREKIREWIGDLTAINTVPPKWILSKKQRIKGSLGTPTLFWSDLHWGEVVDPRVINGSNAYNLAIAHERVRLMVARTLMLLFDCLQAPAYDGITLAMGGDMFSGDIHEELSRTNEAPLLPVFVDLLEVGEWVITQLLDRFEYVFVPCVPGNHGRMPNLKRMPTKSRNWLNFDWLFYVMLKKAFAKEKRVSFFIPDGANCHFRIYNHRYCLNHGDEFRGGDGMIGPLGPITRGNHKKLTGQSSIGLPFDTLIIGHFHNLMMLPHLIVNGSPKGHDEFAASLNLRWERPAQALWITHPERDITFSMPVYLDSATKKDAPKAPWVSWEASK